MLHHTDGPSLQSLRALSVLLFYLLLTHSCTGQFQLIGPSQSIVAGVGDDVFLPCRLKPVVDVTAETVEWTRPDLNPRFIYVRRNGQALVNVKNPAYKERTSMFVSELKHGNLSLKLFKVKPSDQGTYECHIPTRDKLTSVQLVVASGATSSPAISLLGIDRNIGGVILNCESEGWYPEPEVFWLDGEGNLLSAGPTETVRGPDDLYTVSSRVTVEKSSNNNFTCRVQQKNINQTRETHFYVPDDFFEVHFSAAFSSIIGLAVSLAVCILIVLFLVFKWKWRQIKTYTKRSCIDKTEKEEGNSCADSHENKETVTEQLMTDKTEPMEVLIKRKEQKKRKHETEQLLLEEKQRRDEAENRVKMLEEELETKKKEVETQQTELQQLREEKQRDKEEMQKLKEELENKSKELEKKFWPANPLKLPKLRQKKDEAESKAQDVPQKREHKDEDNTAGHVEDEQGGETSSTRSNNSEAGDQEEPTEKNPMATRAFLMS